jgi:CubicO group peptidase (beta-lactamase class C family)
LLAATTAAAAGPPPDGRAVERSRALLSQVLELYPGTSVTVTRHGQLVWAAGFGWSDVSGRVSVSAPTRFRVWDASVAFVTAAALRLSDHGRLDLDSPASKLVPAFDDGGRGITLRQLAAHTGGLRAGKNEEIVGSCPRAADAIPRLGRGLVVRRPGDAFVYSVPGSLVLAAAVEAACGKDLPRCLEEEVFIPSGMTGTILEDPRADQGPRSRFYARGALGMLRTLSPAGDSCAMGAAGWLSTSGDLARFANSVLSGTLLSPKAKEEALAMQRLRDGAETGWGLGWRLRIDERQLRRASVAGRGPGGRAALVVVPEAGLVVAAASNIDGTWLDEHVQQIATYFLEENGVKPTRRN